MEARIVHDASEVYGFLKDKSRYDYTYQFSNLQKEQWNKVLCYGLYDRNEIKQLAMVSMGYGIPVLLAAGFSDKEYSTMLLKEIKQFLPRKFYTHIDNYSLEKVFSQDRISDLEEYMNMGLTDYTALDGKAADVAVRLGYDAIDSIKELMSASYPEAWLDDELVKLDENFGMFEKGRLISFAGIHAYSEEYQVAAVAHITTRPEYRGRGYAEKVTAALANSLKEKIRYIGLNVKVDNAPAISCYKKLGFTEAGRFAACEIEQEG